MFALLVLLVNVTIRAVFPSVVVRPKLLGNKAGMNQKDRYVARCRAHRRPWQWHMLGWFCWFRLALCSMWLQTGPDARHLGRFGPEEHERSWLVSLVTMRLALYSLLVVRPKILGIVAGMDEKDAVCSLQGH